MAGRECGFCNRTFTVGEPFVNVRVLALDDAGNEIEQEDIYNACKECAERTHLVSGNIIATHDRR